MRDNYPREPYATRRGQLMEQFRNGLVLVRGAGAGGRNASFRYLTGIDDPEAMLLLAPAGARVATGRNHPGPDYVRGRLVQQVLFLPPADPMAERWGEAGAARAGAVTPEQLGVEAIFPTTAVAGVLDPVLRAGHTVYWVRSRGPSLAGEDSPDDRWLDRLRRRFHHLQVGDATAAVHEMRRIKDAAEVAAIESAAALTGDALTEAWAALRPGRTESELEACLISAYRARGATHAFDPIVASGANALALHYCSNDAVIEEGQLLLIDTGACLGGYCADISRTVPVDGRFTDRQREVYEAVLAAQQATIAACRPGALLGDLHAEAWTALEERGLGSALVHGIGHHLGLETHDVGDVHRPLVPGAVITIEPGAYLPDEGIGVRIEDDVLITEDGARVLSEAIPRSIDAVERLVGAGR